VDRSSLSHPIRLISPLSIPSEASPDCISGQPHTFQDKLLGHAERCGRPPKGQATSQDCEGGCVQGLLGPGRVGNRCESRCTTLYVYTSFQQWYGAYLVLNKYHPMCSVRVSSLEKGGVLDSTFKVHGIAN